MLHDLARLYSNTELIEQALTRALPVSKFERAHPILLHARLGAEIAREEFAITDEAVLSAISKHTVADAQMSGLDCVVYLADGLEPGRRFPERAALEQLAMWDMKAAMRETIAQSLQFLILHGIAPAPQTLAAAAAFQEVPTARVT